MYRVVDDRQRFRLGVAKRKLAPPRQEAVTAAFDHEDATCVHAGALQTHGTACWGWGWDVVVKGASQQRMGVGWVSVGSRRVSRSRRLPAQATSSHAESRPAAGAGLTRAASQGTGAAWRIVSCCCRICDWLWRRVSPIGRNSGVLIGGEPHQNSVFRVIWVLRRINRF
jgi:hypothetical protein